MDKIKLSGVLLLSCALPSVPAYADIYKCVDDAGRVTYSNVETRGCQKMNLDPISTIPGPKPAPSGKPAAATPTPSGFPKVDGDTQRKRDSDRRKILGQELSNEERNLEQARKELTDQEAVRFGDERNYQKVLDRLQPYKDKVALHERNIEALKRELTNLR
jgi:hypothetical protein